MQLNLLGGFGASEAPGRPLSFPTLKSEALLAYLVLNGTQAQYRDKLSTLLWGSSPDDHARSSLRQALSRVRKAWPSSAPCCLVSSGNTITVDRSAVVVDVTAFERLAVEGTPEALQRAADLYRGDLLDGISINEAAFDDWLGQERARLQELALGVFQRLLEHYANTGAIQRGIAVANRLLSLDPFQEGVQRTLMRFYLEHERRGAALAQYQRCRQVLQRDLGAEPEPETLALYQQILKAGPEPGSPDDGSDQELTERAQMSRASPKERGRRYLNLSECPVWRKLLSPNPSIAVLPFENLNEDSSQRYLCDGVAEDIITELSRFRELYVIARNSAFSYRDNQAPLQRIGRELGVQYLLAGSLRRRGNRIRVTTHLVEAESGHQIWAERYDEPVDDLFVAQDEVVRRIVATLVDRIAAERLLQARRKPPESWKAYDHWLQGMAHLRRVDMNSLALARAAFQKSAETDPGYARAYAGIAMTHYHAWSCFNWHSWAGLEEQASDYARKAVALDENDHHPHSILSTSYVFRREYERARFHIDRAIAINPNDADTLANAALVWSFFGDASKAVESAETAVRLDPYHPDWYSALLGLAYFVGRDYDAAISAMAREPDAMCDTRAYLAAAYALVGNAREAERHIAEFLRSRSEHMGGDPATDVKRYMDWLINANAYRRDEDAEHFIAGLRKAGLPA
ncbi:MAG: BTAD domain-containing putative transcriptional regulator [Proteobacteria bacterium]|nr:BTAD domain-containing putative transcriptional regulator [Pseudomonadota bacterium]